MEHLQALENFWIVLIFSGLDVDVFPGSMINLGFTGFGRIFTGVFVFGERVVIFCNIFALLKTVSCFASTL